MAADVFLDTGGIYALLNTRDHFHNRAARLFVNFTEERKKLITSDYIVAETATLLRARGAGHLTRKLFDALLDSPACAVAWTSEARFRKAQTYFESHDDHSYSFQDCISFVVMDELKIRDAFATDRHFLEAGFRPVLIES